GQVSEQHGGRPQVGFAQRHDRKLDRHAARFEHTAPDTLGDLAKMSVAGRQLRPGVADSDDRASVKGVGRHALILHPTAMHHSVPALACEPGLRTERLLPPSHLRIFLFGLAEPTDASRSARITSNSAPSMSLRMAFSAASGSRALIASRTAR